MFTSRAEHRPSLRGQCRQTLTEKGYQLGLVNDTAFERFQIKMEQLNKASVGRTTWLSSNKESKEDQKVTTTTQK